MHIRSGVERFSLVNVIIPAAAKYAKAKDVT
jgi:hypothetical protein